MRWEGYLKRRGTFFEANRKECDAQSETKLKGLNDYGNEGLPGRSRQLLCSAEEPMERPSTRLREI